VDLRHTFVAVAFEMYAWLTDDVRESALAKLAECGFGR
jgi:hypothetical protein